MTTALAESGSKKTGHLKPYRFKPGVSPNPGGRPKGTTLVELKAAARVNFPFAVERLGQLMRSQDERIALEAAQFVYLYSLGKPQEGRDLAHGDAMEARHQELVAVPMQQLPAPEAVPPTLPEPAPPEAIAPASLTSEVLPEPAAVQVVAQPASAPSGLRCLYRGKEGQCTETAAAGVQWCQPHRDKLFAAMEKP